LQRDEEPEEALLLRAPRSAVGLQDRRVAADELRQPPPIAGMVGDFDVGSCSVIAAPGPERAEGEGHTSPAAGVKQLDLAAVRLDDGPANRESEPGSAAGPRRFASAAMKRLEDPFALSRVDSLARVGHFDLYLPFAALGADRHGAVAWRVPDGVLDEVEEHPLDLLGIRAHRGKLRRENHLRDDPPLTGVRLHRLHRLADELVELDLLQRPLDLSGLQAGQLEEVVDQATSERMCTPSCST
jgi:hypothetical protein